MARQGFQRYIIGHFLSKKEHASNRKNWHWIINIEMCCWVLTRENCLDIKHEKDTLKQERNLACITSFSFLFFWSCETGSHFVVQDGLELSEFLPMPVFYQKHIVLEEMQLPSIFLDKILRPLLWFECEMAFIRPICLKIWSPVGRYGTLRGWSLPRGSESLQLSLEVL